MAKKRRVFDIDMPVEDITPAGETFPAGKPAKRGPMAAAISETVDSTRDRAGVEARIRAENDALAQEHVRLKKAGLITDLVALDDVVTDKLIRDRAPGADLDLAELVASIRELGLSNPIRVESRGDGRFELIQGWRRLSAYRALLAETGDADRWGRIPAGIVATGDQLEQLYRRMVDENLVRKDISFAEMAQLALHYAMDPMTAETDPDKAVALLFKSAGYQKRSYIRSFIKLMQALGDDLHFALEIPRALGLGLVARLEEVDGLAAAIRTDLRDWDNRSVKDELDVLRRYVDGGKGAVPDGAGTKVPASGAANARTVFQIQRPQGVAKCTAANGRLEIKLPRDFSTLDRRKLEAAISALLQQLE